MDSNVPHTNRLPQYSKSNCSTYDERRGGGGVGGGGWGELQVHAGFGSKPSNFGMF